MLIARLQGAIVLFLVVTVVGTAGYHFLEGWPWIDSLWMVAITLTTIGYGETHPLSDAGRLFTLGLIVSGVGISAYSLSQISRFIVEGELARSLAARRRKRVMNKLEGHYIVVGLGRLGREVAEELAHRGRRVVGVEADPHAASGLQALADRIEGDGSSDETLRSAAVDRAHGLAVATGSDATNIFITLSARQLNQSLHIVTRVDEQDSIQKAYRAGASAVVNPYGIGGARIAQGLIRPHAARLMDQVVGRSDAEFEIDDVVIGESPGYNGPLGRLDIRQRHRVMLVAIRRADGRLTTMPGHETELFPGDIAIVVGRAEDIRGFAHAARGDDASLTTRTS